MESEESSAFWSELQRGVRGLRVAFQVKVRIRPRSGMHACVHVCVFLFITHRVRQPARQLQRHTHYIYNLGSFFVSVRKLPHLLFIEALVLPHSVLPLTR